MVVHEDEYKVEDFEDMVIIDELVMNLLEEKN